MARSWTRACVVCSCRSCQAVRRFKMSSRSLGGPTTEPSFRIACSSVASKRSAGKKEARDSRGRKRAGSRIASAPHKGTQREIVTAGYRWWFLLAPVARHGAEELRVEKRHLAMEGVLVCLYVEFLHGKAADADSADATRFTRAPTRGLTAKQCGVRIEGAGATETSEVGSHRVAAG